MEKEKWIEDILNSSAGITKSIPDPALFFRIQQAIRLKDRISRKWVFAIAASLAAIVALNVMLLRRNQHAIANETAVFATEFSTSNQIY